MEKKIEILKALGFEVTKVQDWHGRQIAEAEVETERGTILVGWGSNNCARVVKPNGSVKWYYDKTDAQIRRALLQTMEANNF